MDNVRTKKGMTKYTSSMKETRVPDNAFENVERKYAKLFLKELISFIFQVKHCENNKWINNRKHNR